MSSDDLIEEAKKLLCAPHLELICKCYGFAPRCGACKMMTLARKWTEHFGPRPCQHEKTYEGSWHSKRCEECGAVLGKWDGEPAPAGQ